MDIVLKRLFRFVLAVFLMPVFLYNSNPVHGQGVLYEPVFVVDTILKPIYEVDINPNKVFQTSAIQAELCNNLHNCVLPLMLLTFEGETVDNAVNKLWWTTTNEVNVAGFVLQRSANGQDFGDLSFIEAKNRTAKNRYSFDDTEPMLGSNYYRLRIMDKDGAFEYSPIVHLIIRERKNLQVFPNPAKTMVSIKYQPGIFQLDVFDTHGNQLIRMNQNSLFQPVTFQVNCSNFASGTYHFRLTETKTRETTTGTIMVIH